MLSVAAIVRFCAHHVKNTYISHVHRVQLVSRNAFLDDGLRQLQATGQGEWLDPSRRRFAAMVAIEMGFTIKNGGFPHGFSHGFYGMFFPI